MSLCRFELLQGTDIPVQELHPLYMRTRTREGCSLGPHVLPFIKYTLLLESDWPVNVVSLLDTCGSYTILGTSHFSSNLAEEDLQTRCLYSFLKCRVRIVLSISHTPCICAHAQYKGCCSSPH